MTETEQLTAYALNELPADERAALEARLKTDPDLHRRADEMAAFCAILSDNLGKSTGEDTALTPAQRQEVITQLHTGGKTVRGPFWRHPFLLSSAALAACVTFITLWQHQFDRPLPDQFPSPVSIRLEHDKSRLEGAEAKPEPIQLHASSGEALKKEQEFAFRKVEEAAEKAKTPFAEPPPVRLAEGKAANANHMVTYGNDVYDMDASASQDELQVRAGRSFARGAAASAPAGPVGHKPSANAQPPSMPSVAPAPAAESAGSARAGMTILADVPFEGHLFQSAPAPSANESYTPITENPFQSAAQVPLSTFSIDVDTASYANVRRFLNNGSRPPLDAVRLEELINYFPYDYEPPADGKPFAVTIDLAEAPWQPLHRLARIAIKGREIQDDRGAANFVFLIDVSGSMNSHDKLPLVKQSLTLLTEQLTESDQVAIVTYAGDSSVVLPSTSGKEKSVILSKIDGLKSGGSTHGSSGIRLAYEQAASHFKKDGVNRVILCTDGDFNVGISDPKELERFITEKAKSKIFLSVLGYGTGNLKDRTMETLADKGNGNYAYIDGLGEARKVLVDQMNATLVTIAKDVKIQVEFNPAQVASYRLIGYENRTLAKEDFNNDHKDAGEIGAGHTVTALYEIVPAHLKHPNGQPLVDDLKYAPAAPAEPAASATPTPPSLEIMTVKLRYKQPEGDTSELIAKPVMDAGKKLSESPLDFQFATAVAGFGMLLRQSTNAAELNWTLVRQLALQGKGPDPLGHRGEFIQLVEKARGLSHTP